MSTIAISLVICLFNVIQSQECLSSPPELEWILSGGIYHGELDFDAAHFDSSEYGYPTSFTTRVHNQNLPSPTLRFRRGETYELQLINRLLPDPLDPSIINTIRDLNVTNIHTHGIHISGSTGDNKIVDDVFQAIDGQQTMLYTYDIPCNHAGGTFWYHPHHHGSTSVQVGGGAAGVIIIEDDEEEEGLPVWLVNMEEIILIIQHMDLSLVQLLGTGLDSLFQVDDDANTDFWLINGEYEPNICLNTGEWKRIRISHVDLELDNTFIIDPNNQGQCVVYLIAKDGVLIHGINNIVPRQISSRHLYFNVASRADVVVRCDIPGVYPIFNQRDGDSIIAWLDVSGAISANAPQLTLFQPIRPDYLQSLLEIDVSEFAQFEVRLTNLMGVPVINNVIFDGEPDSIDDYIHIMESGTLQEWTIIGGVHPIHIHINHFQIAQLLDQPIGSDPNWTHIGDWLDIIDEEARVRFPTDTFGGAVVIHCHILEHEDLGTMAVAYIDNGCLPDDSCNSCPIEIEATPSPTEIEITPSPTEVTPSPITITGAPTSTPVDNEECLTINLICGPLNNNCCPGLVCRPQQFGPRHLCLPPPQ